MNAIPGDEHAIAFTQTGIMQALNERERQAVHILYQSYAKPLYLYAFRLIDDREEAKDIVSKTFIKFFYHEGAFADFKKIRNFLYTTTHHLSLNYLRDSRQRRSIEADVFSPVDGKEGFVLNEALHTELSHYLHSLIIQLSEKQQAVIKGLIIEGKTIAEIAKELQISAADVRKSKQRGLQLLKSKILYDQFISWLLFLLWALLSGFRKLF